MVSAVVHTYNEEKNLKRCLSSLISWVDEIIIVDMGSTDATLAIAKQFKAKIFHYSYLGFADPARNFAISKSHNEWVFVLDADEEVSKSLQLLLKRLVEESTFSFFRIPRKNIIFNKWIRHTNWWPDYQIRLFKKGSVSWSDKVHGIPLTHGQGCDVEAKEENAITHYNYSSISQFLERLNRYTTLQAKELHATGQKFNWRDLLYSSSQEFIRRFFQAEGYKDGVHGLVLSLLQSLSYVVMYSKIWELEGFEEKVLRLENVRDEINKSHSEQTYWISDKLIHTSSSINKIRYFLERKLHS